LDPSILLLISMAATAAVVGLRLYDSRRARWKAMSVKGDFTAEHHLPEVLLIPAAEAGRAAEGDFTLDDAMRWTRQFLASGVRHAERAALEMALRKFEFYRELSECMGRGRWNEVDQIAQRLADLDPLDPSAAVARGRAMRQLGQLALAAQFYQKALELRPVHSLALPELASLYRRMGQPQAFHEALDAARKQLGETHPLTIESRVQLGELVRVFSDPTDPATMAHIPREQYIRTMSARVEEGELELQAVVAIGRSMLEDHMPELAEKVLDRCEQQFGGERPEVLMLRGLIERYRGDLASAESSLRESLESEDSASAYAELAAILMERARAGDDAEEKAPWQREAEQHLRLAIDRDPDCLEAVGRLVEPHVQEGMDAVQQVIQPIAKAYPSAWAPWRVLGDAYVAHRLQTEALQAYEQGLSRQRVDALLIPYVTVLEEMKRPGQIIQLAAEIGESIHRRDPMLRWRIAQACCDARHIRQAKSLLSRLVDDEHANAPLRQRAREILQRLEAQKEPEGSDGDRR
jgi:tetratricopeptide (TPR) repeat protein